MEHGNIIHYDDSHKTIKLCPQGKLDDEQQKVNYRLFCGNILKFRNFFVIKLLKWLPN
jgi:hypothetical protein